MIAPFRERLKEVNPLYLYFASLQTLQVNLGNLCNLACSHCHQNASPKGKETMGRAVMTEIAEFLAENNLQTLDITGGTPEMNPDFRYFIERTCGLVQKRILRSNLVIMAEPGMDWLTEFCREQELTITASLPCYLEENVDRQRGRGVHGSSIAVLQRLNSLGYGSDLELNLVYNPGGDYLPGLQKNLEEAYKYELQERYGIIFNKLYIITNAPIGRFREQLQTSNSYDSYMNLLASSFNPGAAESIMCRTLISVDWQGRLYNCDFNQALGIHISGGDGRPLTVPDLRAFMSSGGEIALAQHCYCCTAGEGSSCTGALAVNDRH